MTFSAGGMGSEGDEQTLAALRRGDENAFLQLVSMHHTAMLRIAMVYVGDPVVAEDVVQEAWLGVLKGIDRFEERSSLKTWIFSILANCARTRHNRESRSIPFSDLEPFEEGDDLLPSVDPLRFNPPDAARYPGGWSDPPQPWAITPEDAVLGQEVMRRVRAAIAELPASQQTIITLRDVDGWSSEEVCNVLQISETNQRVLLHRARSKVRRSLEDYFAAEAML